MGEFWTKALSVLILFQANAPKAIGYLQHMAEDFQALLALFKPADPLVQQLNDATELQPTAEQAALEGQLAQLMLAAQQEPGAAPTLGQVDFSRIRKLFKFLNDSGLLDAVMKNLPGLIAGAAAGS